MPWLLFCGFVLASVQHTRVFLSNKELRMMWRCEIEFSFHRKFSSVGLLSTRQWSFSFRKTLWISWPAEKLSMNQGRVCTMVFPLFYSAVMLGPLTFMAQVGTLYQHRLIYKEEWNTGGIIISLMNPKYLERNLLHCQLRQHKSNMDCTSTEPWPVWWESP